MTNWAQAPMKTSSGLFKTKAKSFKSRVVPIPNITTPKSKLRTATPPNLPTTQVKFCGMVIPRIRKSTAIIPKYFPMSLQKFFILKTSFPYNLWTNVLEKCLKKAFPLYLCSIITNIRCKINIKLRNVWKIQKKACITEKICNDIYDKQQLKKIFSKYFQQIFK